MLRDLRFRKYGADLDNKDLDQADEPLRQLLLRGDSVASIWTGNELKSVPAESWDDASFVFRACSGWPGADGGFIVLEEAIVNKLSLNDTGNGSASTQSAQSLKSGSELTPGAAKLDFPISLYLEVMLAWSKAAAGHHKEWTKKEIDSWLRERWPCADVRPSDNAYAQMAGLCRNEEYRGGGVKKNADVKRRKRATTPKA
ncbi:hypothetical protein XI03_31170 [Bradyrhizobium sp. CCBAU 65884]|nr:hypothetical protein [Bradyrhizobium sp. CCBAU 65884]